MSKSTARFHAQDWINHHNIQVAVMDKAAARDISMAELARRCEMSKPRLERHLGSPKLLTVTDVIRLANAFGEKPSDFMDSLTG